MDHLRHPKPDELTITVLGGAGQGESVVIHIGDGNWIIIDSYVSNKLSLAYIYLTSIEANLDNVEMIICSHWHSDHVKGMCQLLKSCPNAKFYVPSVSGSKYYPEFFAGNIKEIEITEEGVLTVMEEFQSCMSYADQNNILDYLERDKTLIKRNVNGQCLEIAAISPSKDLRNRFHKMFASKKDGKYKEYGIEPNMCSSAIMVSVNNELHFLLGADLECNRSEDDKDFDGCPNHCAERGIRGWCNTFHESQNHNFVNKYSYVKIAHHSSETGYCPKLWNEKVTEDVIGVTTVFNANLLPQPNMVELYSERCKEYYISAPSVVSVGKTDHPEIDNLVEEGVVKEVSVPQGNMGAISSSYIMTTKAYLGTQTDGTAFRYK